MAKLTIETYLDLLEKSNLIPPEALAEAVAQFNEKTAEKPDQRANPMMLGHCLVMAGLITPWQNDRVMQGKSQDFFLGKYKLLGHLGTGGTNSVYLGEHIKMRRNVAIRVLPAKLKDQTHLERFLTEARAVAALDHPNIVHAYSVDNQGDVYYMVMEYVDGCDLGKFVKKEGPLPYDKAVRFLRQAAEGLNHAHGRKIIHRDLKPSNFLLDSQETIKILDMGLAVLSDASGGQRALVDGSVPGITDYLSPEQTVGDSQVDERSDLYSLGCTFYYMLSGAAPFPSDTLAESLLKHQTEEPKPLTDYREDVPQGLVKICRKLMAKKPEDRFGSAAKLITTLGVWQQLHESDKSSPAPPRVQSKAAATAGAARSTPSATPHAAGVWPAGENADEDSDGPSQVVALPSRKPWVLVGAALGLVLLAGGGWWWSTRNDGQRAIPNEKNETTASTPEDRVITPRGKDRPRQFVDPKVVWEPSQPVTPPKTKTPKSDKTPPKTPPPVVVAPTKPEVTPAPDPPGPHFADGKIGQALLAGKNSFLSVPHELVLEPDEITIEAWIHTDKLPDSKDKDKRRWLVNKNANENAEGHYALMLEGKRVKASMNFGGGAQNNFEAISGKDVLQAKKWQHVAMTYDGVTLLLYHEGKPVASNLNQEGKPMLQDGKPAKQIKKKRTPGTGDLFIGRRADGGVTPFTGRIDEVRIYNRALLPVEVLSHYTLVNNNAKVPLKPEDFEQGQVRHWNFESSPNANKTALNRP